MEVWLLITIKKQFFCCCHCYFLYFQTLEVKKEIPCPELFTDDPHLGMMSNWIIIVEQFHRVSMWWIWSSHHIQESLWNCSTIFKITTGRTNKSIQPQRYLKLGCNRSQYKPCMDYNRSDKMLLLKYGIWCLIT